MNESPGVFANRIGILPRLRAGRGLSSSNVTWENVLDLAVAAYWRNRRGGQVAA